jgi:NAD(P)-dependent dehydrogenase (short-subunit alcohol dehydrogenase family)
MARAAAVVTGGSQGLGFAYAREFLRRGIDVAICGRREDVVQAAVARLAAEGRDGARAVGAACDTADAASVQALWDLAIREFGRVDIWVNNAGFARSGPPFADTTPAEIESMVRSNVVGTMIATNVAFAGMRRQGSGKLYITLGGGASGRVVRGMTVYSTTKRALRYFADCLVKEGRDSGVLVGTISPGVNVTEGMLREIAELPEADRARVLKPLNFIGEHVETTAPWIVDRILADTKPGNAIVWLTTGRLLRRAAGMMGGRKRDILSRYGLSV